MNFYICIHPDRKFSVQKLFINYNCPKKRLCTLIWMHLCGADDSVTLFLNRIVSGQLRAQAEYRILQTNSHEEFNIFKNVRQWMLLMRFRNGRSYLFHMKTQSWTAK